MSSQLLIESLQRLVTRRHVLTAESQKGRYSQGYRFGGGHVLAVVRPGSLVEQWRCLQTCVDAGVIVIFQASNTGLTGGSTPFGDDYDRDIVIISTLRINRIDVLGGGRQVLCLPGATLDALERTLRPLGREPHSVIGSSCIGASVVGGVCNNSGGSLIHRGPAFTRLALFARLGDDGVLRLVNHLGIDLGSEPEAILSRLDTSDYNPEGVEPGAGGSDHEYMERVRDVDADSPSRFNADPSRLFEASGSAGRLAIFALRLDTFPEHAQTAVFYIGTNNPSELTAIRRHMLARFSELPVAAEYLHRNAFAMAKRYGKDVYLLIERFGTEHMPLAFAIKGRFDAFMKKMRIKAALSDRFVQALVGILPDHLPSRLNSYHDRFEHHLMIRVADSGIEEAREYLSKSFPSATGDMFEAHSREATAAFLLRFATAGAAVRYRAVHPDTVEDLVSLDIALKRNDRDWFETLPKEIDCRVIDKLYYGHFFCHVFHQDYLVKKGEDCAVIERAMLKVLDDRGAQYPAEHNVGHIYEATDGLKAFYRTLDPTNTFNPGIGHTSKCACWMESEKRN